MRLYKRGKVWWVRSTEGGRELRRPLGTRDRREAEQKLATLQRENEMGGASTIGTLMAGWIAHNRVAHYQKPEAEQRQGV